MARTRTGLRDALLALMAERGWDDVSVQDICQRANVGRSTFYLHFQSKEELLEGGLADLCETLRRHAASHDQGSRPPLAFARGLIEHVYEQRRLFRSVVGRRSGHVVRTRFREMVLTLVKEELSDALASTWHRDATIHYVTGGIVEFLAWLAEAKRAVPVSEIEKQLRHLVQSVLSSGAKV